MSREGLYVPPKAYLGAKKMAVFGPNILIILEGSKSSGTHISENHLGTSFALFFVRHQRARKANVWPKIIKVYISSIFIRKITIFSEMICTFSWILPPAQKQLQIPLHFSQGSCYISLPKPLELGKFRIWQSFYLKDLYAFQVYKMLIVEGFLCFIGPRWT